MPLLLPSSRRTSPIAEEEVEEGAEEASRTATAVESVRIIGLIPALAKSTRREIHPTENAVRIDMRMESRMKVPDS